MEFYWENTVFAILAFALLYFLLNKYAFGPLFSVMEKRREMVQEQISSAESNRKEAERLLAEQQKAMAEVRKEAQEILEQARQMSGKEADEMIRQAQEESARIKEEALKDISAEKDKAVAALRGQVSAMAVMIASKIIEKQVDEKSQEQLIDQYLKEVGGKL
ncbi:F0F1 ATP synthase subunit B [Paenibacillus senegalensis]|uniref:F0F1 ATP synthase subunit B n=1 Tax=Paenibacillus senegalensis TaxID=1465766 RepID=UPI000289FBF9|nr:F0F1 ATP synthase subunit B [Paenibacillus senegalensis]